MNDLINFLISDEAITVYIIAFTISIFYIIFYYFRKTSHNRIKKQNTMELKRIVDEDSNSYHDNDYSDNVVVSPIVESENLSSSTVEPVVIPELIETNENLLPNIKIDNLIDMYNNDNNKLENNTIKISEEEVVEDLVDSEDKIEIKEEVAKVSNSDRVDQVLNKLYQTANSKVINTSNELKKEKIEYTNIAPNKEEAIEELKEVTKKLEQEDSNENIQLTEFEQIQEDTAIISLDELMKRAGELYSYNEEVQYKDEGNEPISLADLEKRKQEMFNKKEKKETKVEHPSLDSLYNIKITPVSNDTNFNTVKEETTKFKSSPLISPIYGYHIEQDKVNKNTDIELENTANYEKLDEEIRKTNEFLATLKELQKKLD